MSLRSTGTLVAINVASTRRVDRRQTMSDSNVNSKQMAGKVALITGASGGMGKSTALALARMGARVVLLCRDPARGAAAVEDVKRESGNSQVELLIADLASQQS